MAASALAILTLLCGGAWFYSAQQRHFRQEVERNLQSVGQLKVDRINDWLEERLGDASVLVERPHFVETAARWLRDPQAEDAEELLVQFRSLQGHHHYEDVMLVDVHGQVRLSLNGRHGPLPQDAAKTLAAAFHERRPKLDLHADSAGLAPHVDLIAPLFAKDEKASEPIGAVVFRIDASQFLYPLVRFWPTPSSSAETLLVRRDGDSVLFLNDLRHQPNTALKLRIPLSREEVPAVMAVLGKEGVVEGKDYRVVEVFSVLKAVPQSNWFMVAKVDAGEVLAGLRFRSVLIGTLVFAIAAFLAAAVGMVWQRNQKAHYRSLFQAEAARRKSEERYHVTLMSVGDGVIVTDAAGRVELLNPVAEALTGWGREEASGKPLEEVFRIINEETRSWVENPMRRVISEGLVVGLANHTVLVSRDGTERPIADSGAPIRDKDGTITGVVLVFRDQTEERAAQSHLEREKEKAQQYLDVANVMVIALDADANVTLVNRKGCEILGYREQEIIGKNWCEHFLPKTVRDKMKGIFAGFIDGCLEMHEYAENLILTCNGEERLIAWHNAALRDRHGSIIGTLSSGEDITDRKRTDMSLRESETRYRALFETAADAILIFDAEGDGAGRVLSANPAAAAMHGYTPDELLTLSICDLDTPETALGVRERHNRLMRGETIKEEVTHRRKDGTVFPLEINANLLELDGHKYVLGFDRDITERKSAEEALRRTEEMLRGILATSPVGIVLTQDRRIKWANVAWTKMFGFDHENEYMDQPTRIIYPSQEKYEEVRKTLYDDFRAGEISETDAKLRRKDGTLFEANIRMNLVDPTDPSKGTISAISDISDRKRSEQALRQQLRLVETLLEAIPGPVFYKDVNHVYVGCNEEFARFIGLPKESLIGRSAYDVAPKNLADEYKEKDEELFRNRCAQVYESVVRRSDGETLDVMFHKAPWFSSEGELAGLIGVILETTEQKRAENIIRARVGLFEFAASHTVEELLQKTLDEVGALVNSPIGFYHFVHTDQETLTLQTWSTQTIKEFCKAKGKGLHYPIEQAGVWVDCVRERRPVIHNDYSALPHRKGMPEGHAPVIRELVVPIMRSGRIVAILGVGNKPSDYTEKDVETVSYLADVAWEVTESKLAQEALRESEQRFRFLYEQSPSPYQSLDSEGHILEVNNAWLAELAYDRGEVMGKWFGDLLAGDGPALFRDRFARFKELGEVHGSEFELKRKDGNTITVSFDGRIGRDDKGEFLQTHCVFTNITERIKAEAERMRLASAIEQAVEVVVITDLAGNIRYVNPAFEKVTGYTREEAIGQNPRILKSGEHDATFYRQLWNTIQRGDIWSGRLVNKRKDGRFYYEEATISPVKDASGKITDFVAVKRDITEHLELSNQLFQAQKMEAIGTLAGGVAHDFNNLLQVVLGYSELMLSEENLPAQYKEDLGRMNQAARNGADLVQRLLTFSRKTRIKPLPLNLNRRIEQLQKMLSRTISRMITIELALADDLAAINADPTQVDQILMNLAVNSADAMPEGGKLTIETKNVALDRHYAKTHLGADPGRYVLLSVSDTGHGIDKETLKHIFEPFFTTKGPGEGTGLGLAMVYGIVRQHGGHIVCYSEPSEGTVFRIYFPALVSDEVERETSVRSLPRGGHETILLVDDEELIRDLGARILTGAGYKVITASNGKEALDVYQARSNEIALVILDLVMPEMGGKQCLERLTGCDPFVKVIIASGYSADGATRQTLASGAKGFVNKPYDVRRVLEVVRAVLDQ